ncbi:MAG: hypothetical protein WCG37_02765 [Actinomycetes bacterium]
MEPIASSNNVPESSSSRSVRAKRRRVFIASALVGFLAIGVLAVILTGGESKSERGGYVTGDPIIWTAITASSNTNLRCGLMNSGKIWCWGSNDVGQLGNGGSPDAAWHFVHPDIQGSAKAITAGGGHACALLDTNEITCWGSNDSGAVGNGSSDNQLLPAKVNGVSSATSLASGDKHTCALLSDSTISCWGYNGNGQLGNGSNADSSTPVQVSAITNATKIDVGADHSCALLADSTIWCWGANGNGQLGNGSNIDSNTPVQVSGITTATSVGTGGNHTCALLSTKAAWCWGFGLNGALGNGANNDSSTPVKVTGGTNALSVGVGNDHACITVDTTASIPDDNKVKCWGNNDVGQLGIGTNALGATVNKNSAVISIFPAQPNPTTDPPNGALADDKQSAFISGSLTCTPMTAASVTAGKPLCWGLVNPGFPNYTFSPWPYKVIDPPTN